MDCRKFKELLDSYLSSELAVETNHDMLRHAELCAPCRAELGARRQLRGLLRDGVARVCLSAEARLRLGERLRAEAGGSFFRRVLTRRLGLALAAGLGAAFVLGGLAALYRAQLSPVAAAGLSPALVTEAAGDHDTCASHFRHAEGSVRMAESAVAYDPAYAGLDRVAEVGAEGLKLRAAHLCGFGGRKFAHLVYTRGEDLVSLLVTERDARALREGVVPLDDGLRAGLQQALHGRLAVAAYQTAHHVVLVVSGLSAEENQALAARIALPVSRHLREVEGGNR